MLSIDVLLMLTLMVLMERKLDSFEQQRRIRPFEDLEKGKEAVKVAFRSCC